MDNLAETFASKQRVVLITPAGCGKTELISRAVACQKEGRQLILTHTHAGVKSLRDRLRKLEVPSGFYSIDTIAGFALKYAASFPKSSGLGNFLPTSHNWNQVYEAGTRLLSSNVGEVILVSSYSGLYVDEYQDCTVPQHKLIMKLADVLPCRIAGDPLQGIFDFGDNVLVDWYQDILPHFERLDGPRTPWRWQSNPEFGNWLLSVRDNLMLGRSIDLRKLPNGVTWLSISNPVHICQCQACFEVANETGTVVAIHKLPNQAHYLAQRLKGRFTSMEEVESRDLQKWCGKLEQCSSTERAIAVIDFAAICMTKVSTELKTIRRKLEIKECDFGKGLRKNKEIALALDRVAHSDELLPILPVLSLMRAIQGATLYRRELWHSMQAAIKAYGTGKYDTLQQAAWGVRDRGRIWGRSVEPRIVSRPPLIKGLEFDHSIVLNADELNAKNLYVAMTRGSKSLTVLSAHPIFSKERPSFGIKM